MRPAPVVLSLVLVALAAPVVGAGCSARNLGETCDFAGGATVGEALCAPNRCDPDSHRCVECIQDADCLKNDPLDRPKCMKPSASEGGDGMPFCKHFTDHPACGYPGASAVICLPGTCHPDAGVCVDCLKDGDCPPDRPTCATGDAPDYLPYCRTKDAE